jgi:hypothetical protein
MIGIVEIRTYQLKANMGERFDLVMRERSVPLLKQAGTVVICACPSLHSADSYVLIRGYLDAGHRIKSQHEFYNSQAWLCDTKDAVMECIDTYTTVVVAGNLFNENLWAIK